MVRVLPENALSVSPKPQDSILFDIPLAKFFFFLPNKFLQVPIAFSPALGVHND